MNFRKRVGECEDVIVVEPYHNDDDDKCTIMKQRLAEIVESLHALARITHFRLTSVLFLLLFMLGLC